MNKTFKVVLGLALAVIVAAGGFIGGYSIAKMAPGLPIVPAVNASSGAVLGSEVDEVNRLLQSEALKPPNDTSATAGAINGLLESTGDKYGMYFDAKHFNYFNEEMSGEFGGIGVSLGEKDGNAYIVEVYKGTPADKGKLKAGDQFVAIDGVRRDKWATDEVVKRVRGKQGTDVTITLLRPAKGSTPAREYTVTLTRDLITFPNLKAEMKGDVGYIRLGQFNAKATEEISSAVKRFEKLGARSIVLDLRDNPGGALDQAVGVASLFVPQGVIVRVDERGKPEAELHTTGAKITDLPLFVLINGNSASASEIVGGALQDYHRATLVGEKSFGKGSVQTIKTLSFGGAVKFTTAHYLTPKSRVIDGKGLTPDVLVKMDAEKQADPKTDIQLQRALKLAQSTR